MGKGSSSGLSSALAGGLDTIVARATPAGRGALAIVRLSGPDVERICDSVCESTDSLRPWRASLVDLRDRRGETLETAVAVFYRGPRSFTGENMVEFTLHGSPYLVREVVLSCVRAGAREADPGEFTRRAVANGKMDLLQAEAVRDMIDADTEWQARNARRQMSGVLSERVLILQEDIVRFLAQIEAGLDFSDHEAGIEFELLERARVDVVGKVKDLLSTETEGSKIRDGMRLVIAGRPNAGKSTLFNSLVEKERSIVSPNPGTTRDVIEAEIEVAGVPVSLVDTAGLNAAKDPVEEEGIRRAVAETVEADAVLLVCSSEAGEDGDSPEVEEGVRTLKILTKWDLRPVENQRPKDGWLPVSAVTGQGMEELRARIRLLVSSEIADLGGQVAIARRHGVALARAAAFLECDVREGELAAESVRWALRAVESVIGTVDDEDVLDEVFSRFCIGK